MTDVTGYSPREEWANRLSHGLGLLLGGLGLVLLLHKGWDQGLRVLLSYGLYGTSLVLLYLASTLYHSMRSAAARRWCKLFDHCAIYLLIAGTYTPFTLVGLRGPTGWWLFGTIWALALAGVVFKLFYTGRFKRLSTLIYIAMGWIVVFAAKPMAQALGPVSLGWLLAGGVAYTLGTVFYMRPQMRWSHAIWHGFVIAGSMCHYTAVMLHLL